MLEGFAQSVLGAQLTLGRVLLCSTVSLALGIGNAYIYMSGKKYNKQFVVTLALLPMIVQVIIMLVNGNIGAGVAVAGAFGLVRFRSIPGNARDIGSIFFAMALGFITGMGYVLYGLVFLAVIGAANLLLTHSRFASGHQSPRVLRITIPENLDYDGLFDDLFAEYAASAELDRVKTTNMGSLYELTYLVQLKTPAVPKAFIDALRCRNGNLNIVLSREHTGNDAL